MQGTASARVCLLTSVPASRRACTHLGRPVNLKLQSMLAHNPCEVMQMTKKRSSRKIVISGEAEWKGLELM